MPTDDIEERANRELDREERARHAGELDDASARDSVLALGERAVGLIPGAGALLGYVIGEHIPRRRQERMIEFVREVSEAFGRVEERLDRDFVRGDQFADLTEEVLETIIRRDAAGKRAYYAAALANTATASRPDEEERDRMLSVLDEVRPSHLRLLAVVASTRDLPEGSDFYMGGIESNLMPRLEGTSQEQMRMDWADLERLNVLQNYPSGLMSREGVADLTVRLTDFGRRYLAWITLPEEPDS